MEKFKVPAGVVLLLIRENGSKQQVLLQRRQNTGFADGLLDFSCSGHVEKNETMSDTVLRECREELGICLKKDDIKFICFIHKRDKNIFYYNVYFVCNKFSGEPFIMEKEKCSQLVWADIDCLPDDVLPDRVAALNAYRNGISYLEFGWDK